jgi:peptidyl-prolyl cis-trans isomerase B (cyclophilin B)
MPKLALSIVLSLLLAAVAHALPQSATEPAAESAASPADAAFSALSIELRNVYKSITNKGGVEATDKPVLNKLLERIETFSRQFSSDPRGPAAALMINEWLGEDAKVQSLYEQLLRMSPDNDQLAIAFAKRLRGENRYAQAIDVLRAHSFKPATQAEAMVVLSECLFDENQFAEALAVLESIPEDVLAASVVLKPQIEADKAIRQQYVDFWATEVAIRDAEQIANDLPMVILSTDKGPIVIELFENEAPNTVANFIKLAEQGFYNGTKFHRVMPNFMAQGGDPNTKPDASAGAVPGQGGPGYTIADEHNGPSARKHFAGSVSMANTGAPNSGGSQFFITHQPTPHLNGKHTVFGRVADGLPAARSLQVDDDLKTVVVTRKREHPYEPKTIAEFLAPSPGVAPLGSAENPIEINVPDAGGTVSATMPSAP